MGSKELQFFLTKKYDQAVHQWLDARSKSVSKSDVDIQSLMSKTARDEIKVARENYLNDLDLEALNTDSKFISFDATPIYLFLSHRTPQRAKAITPWVKIIAILRNPVKRAYSQYNMQQDHLPHDSFEAAVYQDVMLMERAHLIPKNSWTFDNATDTLNFNNKFLTLSGEEEKIAWTKYCKSIKGKTSAGIVGRGIYEVQLRHWLHFFPLNEKTLVLKTEDMTSEEGTRTVVEKAVGHLQLTNHYFAFAHKHSGLYQKPIDDRTAETLANFYATYNARLGHLLGREWDNPWPK